MEESGTWDEDGTDQPMPCQVPACQLHRDEQDGMKFMKWKLERVESREAIHNGDHVHATAIHHATRI